MFTIIEERIIESNVETVYDISTDLPNYAEWNPWCIAGFQEAAQGGYADIKVLLGRQEMQVRHKVLEMVPNERFVWEDTGFFTCFAKGTRSRTFTKQPDGENVLYRCELNIGGPFSALTKVIYKSKLETGMKAEADALKETAEKLSAQEEGA